MTTNLRVTPVTRMTTMAKKNKKFINSISFTISKASSTL